MRTKKKKKKKKKKKGDGRGRVFEEGYVPRRACPRADNARQLSFLSVDMGGMGEV